MLFTLPVTISASVAAWRHYGAL